MTYVESDGDQPVTHEAVMDLIETHEGINQMWHKLCVLEEDHEGLRQRLSTLEQILLRHLAEPAKGYADGT